MSLLTMFRRHSEQPLASVTEKVVPRPTRVRQRRAPRPVKVKPETDIRYNRILPAFIEEETNEDRVASAKKVGLNIPRHRATTANLASMYPWQSETGFGANGVYLGNDVLAGGAAFCFDPWQLYADGTITGANMLIIGEVGTGKSTTVKTWLYRSIGLLGSPGGLGRWCAIIDPKGEYAPLAAALNIPIIKLYPGGTERLNPLDSAMHVAGRCVTDEQLIQRRTETISALIATILSRELTPFEDAAVGFAIESVTYNKTTVEPTLSDLARLLSQPTQQMLDRAEVPLEQFRNGAEAVRFGLGKLLDRQLRGMFDGQSTVRVDWSSRGVVIDVSSVLKDHSALRAVMVAGTGWLQGYMAIGAESGIQVPRRMQILDECWAILSDPRTARYLQAAYKLSRTYGVVNVSIAHRLSDLRAQADDGSMTMKVAEGLLADTQTRVILRQASDQLEDARTLLRLSDPEVELIGQLRKGRALWKIAGRTAVVHNIVSPRELLITNTDQNM
jgi:type IV secretory pathway VirB4 component